MGKRIAFLGYNEPDGKTFRNGVVRVIYNQAQVLKERGFEIFYYHLFSRERYCRLNRFLKENAIDIAVWHMTTLKVRGRLHTPCPLICLWHSTPFFYNDTSSFCEKYHIDGFVARLLKTKFANGIFIKLHYSYNALAFSFVTASADKMVLLSDKFIPKFLAAKLFPKKVTAITNFLNRDLINAEIDLGQKKKEVLFVGRLDNKQKRIDLLLKVWELIEKRFLAKDWLLMVCGSGRDLGMLMRMKDEWGLKNVQFKGFVKPEEYYNNASVFCMTSPSEGMPMALAEAAAFGCVPMAFDAFESVSDLITDNENGRLIKAFDVDAYAEALYQLMMDENERNRMAINAKRDVKRFDPEKIMDEWEQMFEEVQKKN